MIEAEQLLMGLVREDRESEWIELTISILRLLAKTSLPWLMVPPWLGDLTVT